MLVGIAQSQPLGIKFAVGVGIAGVAPRRCLIERAVWSGPSIHNDSAEMHDSLGTSMKCRGQNVFGSFYVHEAPVVIGSGIPIRTVENYLTATNRPLNIVRLGDISAHDLDRKARDAIGIVKTMH